MYEQLKRYGEQGNVPPRTGRYYKVDSQWWVSVRRGSDKGPFKTKALARQALVDYLKDQFTLERQAKLTSSAVFDTKYDL